MMSDDCMSDDSENYIVIKHEEEDDGIWECMSTASSDESTSFVVLKDADELEQEILEKDAAISEIELAHLQSQKDLQVAMDQINELKLSQDKLVKKVSQTKKALKDKEDETLSLSDALQQMETESHAFDLKTAMMCNREKEMYKLLMKYNEVRVESSADLAFVTSLLSMREDTLNTVISIKGVDGTSGTLAKLMSQLYHDKAEGIRFKLYFTRKSSHPCDRMLRIMNKASFRIEELRGYVETSEGLAAMVTLFSGPLGLGSLCKYAHRDVMRVSANTRLPADLPSYTLPSNRQLHVIGVTPDTLKDALSLVIALHPVKPAGRFSLVSIASSGLSQEEVKTFSDDLYTHGVRTSVGTRRRIVKSPVSGCDIAHSTDEAEYIFSLPVE